MSTVMPKQSNGEWMTILEPLDVQIGEKKKEMNPDPYLTPYRKSNSKQVINLKSKTIKLSEENT